MAVALIKALDAAITNTTCNMESLLVTLIGGALGGLIYALAVALEERRKNK